MEILHAREIALELMEKHGLIAKGWQFKWSYAIYQFGYCLYSKFDSDRGGIIGLSQELTHLNGEVDVVDTILHEIAHALVGKGHGHDDVWRTKALEIGCDGKRCYDNTVITPEYKYKAVCPTCAKEYLRHKKRNKVSCGVCSKIYDPNNLLVWELVR